MQRATIIQSIKLLAFFLLTFISATHSFAQTSCSGVIIDATTKLPIPFANIIVKNKNIGTSSSNKGGFSIKIPKQNENDTLTFSIVGYEKLNLLIKNIITENQKTFQLKPKSSQLKEVTVSSQRLKEKKFGLKSTPFLLYFYEGEGAHNPKDTFELSHLIKLGNTLSKITSINLFTGGSVSDSAIFRVNFYAFDGKGPTHKLVDKNIQQTCFLKPGWLTIDLTEYDIYLKGNIIAALEYIPSSNTKHAIDYNVKIGGFSRTFVRTSSLPNWEVPPAHYRIFVTALVLENGKNDPKDEEEEKETEPTIRMFSQFVKDSFSIFVKLPAGYNKQRHKKYPTAYLLDGNVYVDAIGTSIKQLNKEKLVDEAILVGVGYKDFWTGDSLRERDFSFPKGLPVIDSLRNSGGGEDFFAFIQKELVPYIDKTYKTDTSNRTIMGHSLGGYFALYALCKELNGDAHLFENFIAASPSIGYHNGYLPNQFKQVINAENISRKLYLTMGSLEFETELERQNFTAFSKELSGGRFQNLKCKTETYPNRHHMETAIPSFEKGLQFMISKE